MQDKGRGSLCDPPASHTAPQSGSGIFHRWSEFQLFAGTGGRKSKSQRKNRLVSAFRKVAVTGGFRGFCKDQRGGHFSPPGVKSGVYFSSHLTTIAILTGPGGDKCKDLRQQQVDTSEIKNAEQQAAAQHEIKTKIVRSSAFPSVAAQSSAQKSQPADP